MSTRSFGSITLESTGRYRARYTGPDGRRYSAGRFATRKAAIRQLARVEDRIDARTWLSPTEESAIEKARRAEAERGNITVTKWANRWLDLGARRWTPRTLSDYDFRVKKHVLPYIGESRLDAVTASEIDRWYEHLLVANSKGVPRPVYMTVRSMFAAAVKARLIDVSPVQVEGAGRHRPLRAEPKVLTRAEGERLAATMLQKFRLTVWVGLWCGLRRAEIVGLQLGDFDLDLRLLHVRRQVVTDEQRNGARSRGEKRKLKFAPPKYGSFRTVGMPKFLADMISAHVLTLGDLVCPETRMFPGRCATGTIHPNRLGEAFAEAADAAGLSGFTPHSMRHTSLTWAARAGATTRELMDIAGHKSPEIAMKYQHSNGERQRQIADLMGA